MTKAAAIQAFWSSFGLTAYEENSVPTGEDAPAFPYITYSFSTNEFLNDTALSASLWYRSTSWVTCNAKAEQVSEYIGLGGRFIACDGGKIWIKRGTPFSQNMGDPNDEFIKRKYLNITAEFLTVN